jgi:hypothetical protein
MYRGKLLAVAVSVAALATTAAPAGAAQVRPEPQSDHIIAILIGQVQAPPATGFFKQATGLDSESQAFAGFMDYTDDV